MRLENTATLRYDLTRSDLFGTAAASLAEEIAPDNCIAFSYIPQSLGDQIWVWYEFKTPEEKEEFILSIPLKYRQVEGFVATGFTQQDLDDYA